MFLVLWTFHSERLMLGTNDEGINLDAAARMLHGQKLYVDFWGYMSPGSIWNHWLSFKVMGLSQRAGRLPVIASFAVQCGVLFVLAGLLASRAAALTATLLFFAFQTARLNVLTSQHRWESGALSAVAVLLVLAGCLGRRALPLAVAGMSAGYSAVCTPSMGLLAAVTAIWLWATGRRGRLFIAFVVGVFAAGLFSLLIMWMGGYLGGFWEQMQWLSRKYSNVNIMPYGSLIGGYGAMFNDASGRERIVRAILLIFFTIPAWMPPAAGLAWGGLVLQRRELPLPRNLLLFLLLSTACLIFTAFPRADVEHLGFVAAVPYALAAGFVAGYMRRSVRGPLVGFLCFGAALFAWSSWSQLVRDVRISTPVGVLRAIPEEGADVVRLLGAVQPGDSLFVYPYRPLFYFLTQSVNPTRYSYMNPGMADEEDERIVLDGLRSRPPNWVLFLDLSEEEYRRVFPSGQKGKAHFEGVENWIRSHYRPFGFTVSGYQLLIRKER